MYFPWSLVVLAVCHGAFARIPAVEPEYLDILRLTGQYEELARLLGLEDASLLRPSEERSDGYVFTNVSPLGDILLKKEQLEQGRQGINLDQHPESRWPNNTMPYVIGYFDFLPSQKKFIEQCIADLNNLINLNIRPRVRSDRDYVRIINGNGCYSYLGRTGGPQTLSLQSNGCLNKGTVIHELIHAIGCTHEHNRPDRDDHVTVLWENIPRDWHSQYEKVSAEDFGIQGPYDHYSVMHYPLEAPRSGKPAFDILNKTVDGSSLGQREGPTAIDIEKVNTLYP